jgi:hypothetical protein
VDVGVHSSTGGFVVELIATLNSQDPRIASGDLACKASLSTPFNAVQTMTSGAKTVTGATVNHDTGTVNGTSVCNALQSHRFQIQLPGR